MIVPPVTRDPDAGFSLVELAVYIVALGVIMAVVTAVMITLFRSEQTVSAVTNSTSDSQNMVAVLSGDVRNARQFETNPSGTVFTASVAGSDAAGVSWQCVRWTVAGAGSNWNVSRQTRADAPTSTWSDAPTLVGGVSAKGSSNFFAGTTSLGARGTLQYAMQVATTGDGVIDVSGQASNTAQGVGTSSNCF